MNYLLFVYYRENTKDTEELTKKIAEDISNNMNTSNEIRFMYGERHAIFHFSTKMSTQDIGEFVDIISFEREEFEFLLTQKSKNYHSNFNEDNLAYLMTLKGSGKKKETPKKLSTKNLGEEFFYDIADIITKIKRPEVCNMTLDELLDKIVDQGADSLTDIEKQKLEEYSKSI